MLQDLNGSLAQIYTFDARKRVFDAAPPPAWMARMPAGTVRK